jgi:uncharacterized membrane protein
MEEAASCRLLIIFTPFAVAARNVLPGADMQNRNTGYALAVIGLGVGLIAAPVIYRGLTAEPRRHRVRARREQTRAALGGPRGVRVREAITLAKPVDEVYRFWRRLENLPGFMHHLISVAEIPPNRSHWKAHGPAGTTVEWDAEIINDIENKLIAWRSLPGSHVVSAGSVNFDPARAGRLTGLTVHLQYDPPAGRAGAAVSRLLGADPVHMVREDLRRLKQLLEAGEIISNARTQEEQA